DLVAFHHSGVHQRPRVARPTPAATAAPLLPARQRLYHDRTTRTCPAPRSRVPAPAMARDPRRFRPTFQSPASRVASPVSLLLGHRPSRVRDRSHVQEPCRPPGPLSGTVATCHPGLAVRGR